MVDQHPHTCTYLPTSEDVWDGVNATWIAGQPGESIEVPCRARPSGSGKKTMNQDGVLVEYAFDLSFPADINPIPVGTELTIRGIDGAIITTSRLLSFFSGGLHKRGSI